MREITKTYGIHDSVLVTGSPHFVLSLPVGAPRAFSVQREDGLGR